LLHLTISWRLELAESLNICTSDCNLLASVCFYSNDAIATVRHAVQTLLAHFNNRQNTSCMF